MSIDNSLRFAQTLSTMSDVYSKGIVNKYLDSSTKADLDIKLAELHRIVAETGKTKQETDNLVKQAIESTLRAEGLRLNNAQLKGIQDAYIDAMNATNAYEAELSRKRSYYLDSESRWSHDMKRNEWLKLKHEFEDSDTNLVRFLRKRFSNPLRSLGLPSIIPILK